MKVFRTAALAVMAAMALALTPGDTARGDEPAARSGKKLEIKLKWNNRADVDLHVTEPDGALVDYTRKTSKNGGRLSKDANARTEELTDTPEEVYEIDNALRGSHKIKIHMFRTRDIAETPVTVEIYVNGQLQDPRDPHRATLRENGVYEFEFFMGG